MLITPTSGKKNIINSMKTIKIADKRVLKFLQDKDELVTAGRRISDEITRIETKITDCETKEKKITEKRV